MWNLSGLVHSPCWALLIWFSTLLINFKNLRHSNSWDEHVRIDQCPFLCWKSPSWGTVADCRALDVCWGRKCCQPLWASSSCSPSCWVSIRNPLLHKNKVISIHFSSLFSALHSFWEYSFFTLSWISNLYPWTFEIFISIPEESFIKQTFMHSVAGGTRLL